MTRSIQPGTGSVEQPGPHRARFRIGGVSVEVSADQAQDVALVPSLKPFQVELGPSDISIRVEWAGMLTPFARRQLFDSGTTWRCYEDEGGLRFDFNSPVFGKRPYKRLLVDRGFQRATLKMNRASFLDFPCAAEPLEYPLDELLIMHRLTQEKAIELHGSGIVRPDGTGNLFVGHSGAGKSTTTRLWTAREQVQVLSDDRIIVRRDGATMPSGDAEVEDGAGILRRGDRSASPSGCSAPDDTTGSSMRMYGTPWHGEAMFASPGSAPVARIFVLEHGQGNVLTRLSPGQAVAELFARSFVPFHQHEYVDSALGFLQEVVNSVPVYRYAFEPDERAVETILNFHE